MDLIMNNVDDAISDALGVAKNIKREVLDPKPLAARPATAVMTATEREVDTDVDYRYSRENFYNLIERGQDAITGILDLAKEQEHPRTYEVAGQLIKTVSEVTERLADLQEKMQRLKEVPDTGPKSVTNALFVGSTKELQALLKDKSDG
ncbi:MAG: terminase [Candidatus Pacebacteria bacterium]|jgi:hypothetical protein|nr:terminase [Candidatus Paceibacterota bacterium]|tara:strand:- start:262 stop:708 length:447 start_codon:yes stop_codon:yes gene_type:complete